MSKPEYNNNIFSFNGRIGRVSYIIQNCVINTLAFRFIYYPAIVRAFHVARQNPESLEIMRMLSDNSEMYASLFRTLGSAQKETASIIVIGYLFLIPLRLIDIKRVRDIVNDELSLFKTVAIAVLFSIPYVDLIATIFLSVIGPNRFAKSDG